MPHCILFVGEEEVARAQGNWMGEHQIRIRQNIAAADNVNRMLIDDVNYLVVDYANFVFFVNRAPNRER